MPTAPSVAGASPGGDAALVAALSSPADAPAGWRPDGYDASNAAYTRLRQAVLDSGLMDRRYDYYLLRGLTSFALFVGALALVFTVPPGWGWTILAAVVLGFTQTQLGIIGHDAGHMAIFRSERNNFLIGELCLSLVLGVSFWSWRERHNRHHVMTNDEDEDPDLELGGIFTLNAEEAATQRGLRRWITRYQAYLVVPVVTFTLDWAFRIDGWRYALTELRGRRRVVEIALLLLSHAAWASPFLVLGWRWVVIYVGAQWVGNFCLGMSFAPNHKGMPTWAHGTQLTFLERQVLSSCNIRPGRVTDYFYCGLNYQIEHHLFPSMPRVNFSRVRTMVMAFCDEHRLPYEELSVGGAYRQAIGEMHRCGLATRG